MLPSITRAQSDPGPRSGDAGAGGVIPNLDPALLQAFNTGAVAFSEVEAPNAGLGPRFNSDSCVSCHSQPAAGGTSPAANPLTQFANSSNRLPSFITPDGPIREARFISNPDGSPDGGVHDLFTISGRSDTPSGCNLQQPDFAGNASNTIFRIPTPVFGLGLIEAIPDSTLASNLAQNGGAPLGIHGRLNRNGNDGTVTRFGWKAQNKSLLLFAAEAYNVEMGITNLTFNTERDDTPNCSPAASPNSSFFLGGVVDDGVFDDVNRFANFMRFLAPPAPAQGDATVQRGSTQFVNIGCSVCHTATLQTGPSSFPVLANQTIHPYSDFALHHMGGGLSDQVSQGIAGGDEFRTAPLWGLGQRLFFLHDGRTTDLLQAILAHADGNQGGNSQGNQDGNSQGGNSQGNGTQPSEANAVIQSFRQLSVSDRQAILNFLRSL